MKCLQTIRNYELHICTVNSVSIQNTWLYILSPQVKKKIQNLSKKKNQSLGATNVFIQERGQKSLKTSKLIGEIIPIVEQLMQLV